MDITLLFLISYLYIRQNENVHKSTNFGNMTEQYSHSPDNEILKDTFHGRIV